MRELKQPPLLQLYVHGKDATQVSQQLLADEHYHLGTRNFRIYCRPSKLLLSTEFFGLIQKCYLLEPQELDKQRFGGQLKQLDAYLFAFSHFHISNSSFQKHTREPQFQLLSLKLTLNYFQFGLSNF